MLNAMSFLRRSDIAIHTAATNEDLLVLHVDKNAHLITTHPALPGMACDSLCDIIRKGDSMKKVSILLLCDGSSRQQELARRCNVNAVLTRPVDTATFAGKVQELLDIPPRHAYRVVLNISVEGVHNNRPILCNSENVSAGGMLISTRANLSAGDRVECSFYLPDGYRVKATGDIVRVTVSASAVNTVRCGIRFQAFSPGAESALVAFIDQEIQRLNLTGPRPSALVA